jgi:hypothetical protein
MRLPLHNTEPADPAELKQVLGRKGIWVGTYLSDPQPGDRPANCFFYVCRAPDYTLDSLRKKVRASIRRGLQTLTVRLCTWAELLEKGYQAYADTDERHGYPVPSRQEYEQFLQPRLHSPFLDVWGAWSGEQLAAWITVLKVDDWAMMDAAKSATSFLNHAPNNTLYFVISNYTLVKEARAYITSGLSTIQVGSDPRDLHRFKLKMGYETVPVRREFRPHKLLLPVLKSRLAARMWDALAARFPRHGVFGKVAGMANAVAGLEVDPLAWAGQIAEDGDS